MGGRTIRYCFHKRNLYCVLVFPFLYFGFELIEKTETKSETNYRKAMRNGHDAVQFKWLGAYAKDAAVATLSPASWSTAVTPMLKSIFFSGPGPTLIGTDATSGTPRESYGTAMRWKASVVAAASLAMRPSTSVHPIAFLLAASSASAITAWWSYGRMEVPFGT